jgi:hypothetical protein
VAAVATDLVFKEELSVTFDYEAELTCAITDLFTWAITV